MGRKILIVDDEIDIVDMLKRKLERSGYESFTALNGIDGYDVLQHEDIDLVITDAIMPGMDGQTLCSKLLHKPGWHKIPVIVISACSDIQEEFNDIGADVFIAKPCESSQMLEAVETILKRYPKQKKCEKILVQTDMTDDLRDFTVKVNESETPVQLRIETNTTEFVTEALRYKPDIVVLDLEILAGNTVGLIKTLKSYTAFTGLIVITGGKPTVETGIFQRKNDAFEKLKQQCVEAGASGHIDQKLNKGSLLTVIFDYC